MYCRKCGKQVEDDSKFCKFCGINLDNQSDDNGSIASDIFSIDYRNLAENIKKGTLIYLRDILSMEFSVNKLEHELRLKNEPIIIHDYWFYWRYYDLQYPICRFPFCDKRIILSYSFQLNKYYYTFTEHQYKKIALFDAWGEPVNHQFGNPCYGGEVLDKNTRDKFFTLPVIRKKFFKEPELINRNSTYWTWEILHDNGFRLEPFVQIKNIIEDFENRIKERENKYQKQLPILKKEIKEIESEIEKAKKILDDLYSVNIIPTKYRNIGCAYFIYDFFSSSNITLSNVFLHLDLDKIQSQLDTVIKNQQISILQQAVIISQNEEIIAQNQHLFDELSKININTSSINSKLCNIYESSIETSQWAKIAASNVEACAWIGVANYLK